MIQLCREQIEQFIYPDTILAYEDPFTIKSGGIYESNGEFYMSKINKQWYPARLRRFMKDTYVRITEPGNTWDITVVYGYGPHVEMRNLYSGRLQFNMYSICPGREDMKNPVQLAKAFVRIVDAFQREFDMHICRFSKISDILMQLLPRTSYIDKLFWINKQSDVTFMARSIYGGCRLTNPVPFQSSGDDDYLIQVDINSMHPTAMLEDYPVGGYANIVFSDLPADERESMLAKIESGEYLAILCVNILSIGDRKIIHPVFNARGNRIWTLFDPRVRIPMYNQVITSVQYREGIANGVKYELLSGSVYKSKGPIFRDTVLKLYKIRREHPEFNAFMKDVMNYGINGLCRRGLVNKFERSSLVYIITFMYAYTKKMLNDYARIFGGLENVYKINVDEFTVSHKHVPESLINPEIGSLKKKDVRIFSLHN